MTLRRLKLLLLAVAGVIWIGLFRLVAAFLRSELDWETVASYSRRDAPWYYRLSAVWGGLAGSLWLFTAIVAAVAVLAARRLQARAAVLYCIGIVGALAATGLIWVNPFRRLAIPAVGGFGLTPILEQPAMAVHPPLLYVGLACTLPVCLLPDPRRVRNWLRAALAAITLAMALGGLWSYLEQGWGGYWAWDPVENTSLMVWLAVLIALHRDPPRRLQPAALALPWSLTLIGACIVRSGSTPSIHGFGQQAAAGWALLGVTILSSASLVVMARRDREADPVALTDPAVMSRRVLAVVLVITALGTVAPIVIDIVGNRPAAVRGRFYSAFVGPAALIGLPFLINRIRRIGARGWLAHVGALVLLVGIAASTFDSSASVIVAHGATVRAAGVSVTNEEVRVAPGPRQDSVAVTAVVVVDGQRQYPSLVAFRDRGGRLNENAIISRPWRDIQVQLDTANDAGVVTLTVRTRPLMWLVWLGAVMIALGALVTRRPRSSVADAPACEPADR